MFRPRSLITVALAPVLASLGCGGDDATEAPALRPVRYQRVFESGAARVRRFAGVARAGVESRLSFRVGGIVQTVPVEVGDSVRAHQTIATLDAGDYRLELQRAEAQLRQAQAEERNARAQYERVRALYENNNASRSDLDAARSAYESAVARVQSADNQAKLASSQLSYTRLAAPTAGAIANVSVEVNENVQPGQVVAHLTSGNTPEVEVAIPEVLITSLREGDSVTIYFDALDGGGLPGTVTQVGVASTGTATTFPVTVQLSRADSAVRSGMTAEVAFAFQPSGSAPRSRIEVPTVAVGEDAAGRFVWLVEPADSGLGTVHRRTVTVGELTTEGLEVLAGVVDGDRVVTAGMSQLREGQVVRLRAADAAAP